MEARLLGVFSLALLSNSASSWATRYTVSKVSFIFKAFTSCIRHADFFRLQVSPFLERV